MLLTYSGISGLQGSDADVRVYRAAHVLSTPNAVRSAILSVLVLTKTSSGKQRVMLIKIAS